MIESGETSVIPTTDDVVDVVDQDATPQPGFHQASA